MRTVMVAVAVLALLTTASSLQAQTLEYHDIDDDPRLVPGCTRASFVVGRSECARFARWALPPGTPRIQVAMGGSYRRLGRHGLDFNDPGAAATFRGVGPAVAGGMDAGTVEAFDLRFTGTVAGLLHLGVEASLGRARISDAGVARAGWVIDEDYGLYRSAGGLVGLAGFIGPLVIRGEALIGARAIDVQLGPTSSASVNRSSEVQAIVEPRLGAELWLSPWITLGGRIGSDLLREGDLLIAIQLTGYVRAFDGQRGRSAGR